MKIKRINQIEPVAFTGGVSFRAIIEKDNMGFGVCKTTWRRATALKVRVN